MNELDYVKCEDLDAVDEAEAAGFDGTVEDAESYEALPNSEIPIVSEDGEVASLADVQAELEDIPALEEPAESYEALPNSEIPIVSEDGEVASLADVQAELESLPEVAETEEAEREPFEEDSLAELPQDEESVDEDMALTPETEEEAELDDLPEPAEQEEVELDAAEEGSFEELPPDTEMPETSVDEEQEIVEQTDAIEEAAETEGADASLAEDWESAAEPAEPQQQELPEVFDASEETVSIDEAELSDDMPVEAGLEEPTEDLSEIVSYQQGDNEFGFQGTCGPTSGSNCINTLYGTNALSENDVLSVAVNEGLCMVNTDSAADSGGTSTNQMEQLLHAVSDRYPEYAVDTEVYEYDQALSVEQMAYQLEQGNVLEVAVDSATLWDQADAYENNGLFGGTPDVYSDHWISVTGVDKVDGEIAGFHVVDSGGGIHYLDAEQYQDACFGTDDRRVIDPTCIVVSKKIA